MQTGQISGSSFVSDETAIDRVSSIGDGMRKSTTANAGAAQSGWPPDLQRRCRTILWVLTGIAARIACESE